MSNYASPPVEFNNHNTQQSKAWISLAPFAGAALVAISRTMDYRRMSLLPTPLISKFIFSFSDHWQDVLVGSLLGTIVSYFSYRQYYPSLTAQLSHRPYSPRIKREDAGEVLPIHQRSLSPNDHESSLLSHQQHQLHPNPTTAYINPFPEQRGSPSNSGHGHGAADDYELAGTVQHPAVPLEEVWKDGEGKHSVSRSLGGEPTSTPNPYGK
ncbi:hypothetical protein DXG03_001158 [Asterophora parasitica]|uniref:Uncharacterized protein n=1 Tax=Asterophora parasitica TaxID=117018 RepID=A0A9P7GB06_9AGAR|nr:hypothetical protein DXG03_001158 [Asterophora parasitica]